MPPSPLLIPGPILPPNIPVVPFAGLKNPLKPALNLPPAPNIFPVVAFAAPFPKNPPKGPAPANPANPVATKATGATFLTTFFIFLNSFFIKNSCNPVCGFIEGLPPTIY